MTGFLSLMSSLTKLMVVELFTVWIMWVFNDAELASFLSLMINGGLLGFAVFNDAELAQPV